MKEIAGRNKVKQFDWSRLLWTITPPVIPGTFLKILLGTHLTHHISRDISGRLEALFNYQTLITELTGLPVANASLLIGTAAAEAMILAYTQGKKKDFIVDDKIFPQTLEVLQTRAKPLGLILFKLILIVQYQSLSFLMLESLYNYQITWQFKTSCGVLRLAEVCNDEDCHC